MNYLARTASRIAAYTAARRALRGQRIWDQWRYGPPPRRDLPPRVRSMVRVVFSLTVGGGFYLLMSHELTPDADQTALISISVTLFLLSVASTKRGPLGVGLRILGAGAVFIFACLIAVQDRYGQVDSGGIPVGLAAALLFFAISHAIKD